LVILLLSSFFINIDLAECPSAWRFDDSGQSNVPSGFVDPQLVPPSLPLTFFPFLLTLEFAWISPICSMSQIHETRFRTISLHGSEPTFPPFLHHSPSWNVVKVSLPPSYPLRGACPLSRQHAIGACVGGSTLVCRLMTLTTSLRELSAPGMFLVFLARLHRTFFSLIFSVPPNNKGVLSPLPGAVAFTSLLHTEDESLSFLCSFQPLLGNPFPPEVSTLPFLLFFCIEQRSPLFSLSFFSNISATAYVFPQ